MTTRQEVSNVSFVRSKLPSRSKSGDGHISNGEAFGRLTSEAIQLAGQYKLACAKATKLGQRLPPPPPEIDGVGLNFFTSISQCSTPMQQLIVIGKMSMQLTIPMAQHKFGLSSVQTMHKRTK